MDRKNFAERQAAMTATWFDAVKRREGDVEAYINKRYDAYTDRWKEAGRFITQGARVLDVGGGNLFPALFQYIKQRELDYHYIDVDEAAVSSSRSMGAKFGFDEGRFNQGFNDKFDFESESFDFIFSSHCIEHSIDLTKTFAELNRLLKFGGGLLMAVPFGWEENPEHPYFFSPEEWISLVEDAGFEIRVAQIGKEYPEQGYDYFISARKVRNFSPGRINPSEFEKSKYKFISFDHSYISYAGDDRLSNEGNARHLRGSDWVINIALPFNTSVVLPIFLNHSWSAKIKISSHESDVSFHDLFSFFPYIQPCFHPLRNDNGHRVELKIEPAGKNTSSYSTEGVLYGVLYK